MMTALRTVVLVLVASVAMLTFAQPQWSAPLQPISKDGYYTLVLSPEVVGRSHADLGDLRLLDSLNHEVPYVVEFEPAMYEHTWMRTYKLLRNERVNKRTIIEMEADSAATVDELQVRIRNAMVSKRARITGSDDRENWYMILDECLSVGEGDGATNVLRFVDLPLSDYRYYRITLNDSLTAPVQVLDLGHCGRARSEGRYTAVRPLMFTRVEDRSTSRIALFSNAPFKADRFAFEIRNDGPYLRRGSFMVRVRQEVQGRIRKTPVVREEQIGNFTIASYGRGTIAGPGAITDTLFVDIENQSDRPLEITGIRAFQLEHRLIAKLNAGMRYTISTSDAKASKPRYDLEQFRDSIPASISALAVPAMMAAPPPIVEEPPFSPGKHWLWIVLVSVGAIIAFGAIRLLRQTGKAD